MSAQGREIILGRIRAALAHRGAAPDPGPPIAGSACQGTAVSLFTERFRQNGGEVFEFSQRAEARAWLEEFARGFSSVAVGLGVPQGLVPPLPFAPSENAGLGVSQARFAVAETGSLLLSSREGRLVQLLPPCHLIWVRAPSIVGTLTEALALAKADLPSALALHSGPSRSADIGQIMVRGVHGPGRTVVGILGE